MRRCKYGILAAASAAATAVILPSNVKAVLIAGDSFLLGSNYAAGQYQSGVALKNQPSNQAVSGFVTGAYSAGTGTSNMVVNATGCNYPSLGASSLSSGRVQWLGYSADTNTRSAARSLTTVPDSSVYYEEMLLVEGTATNFAANVSTSALAGFGNAQVPIAGDSGTTTAATGLYFGFANDGVTPYTNDSGNLVIRYNTGNTDSSGNFINADAIVVNGSTGSTTPLSENLTYCVVAKITVPAVGLDTVNWWLNPTSGTTDASLNTSSAAMGTFTGNIVSGSNPGSSFARLSFISQGYYTAAYWDEPRLSTDLAGIGFVTQSNLTWTGAADGTTWDASTANWNNASGAQVSFNTALHDIVNFTDANNGNYNIILYGSLSPGATNINNSAGSYVFNGAGVITGSGALTKTGTGSLTINNSNNYSGGTIVNGGSLILASNGALPSGRSLTIGTGASVIASGLGSTTALKISTLTFTGGFLDVQNTGLDLTSTSISTVTTDLAAGFNSGKWNGTAGAIVSSIAAADSSHLTALGAILNDNGSGTALYGSGGTLGSTFDGVTPADGDVLVKFTYYGDTNLDGKVDGTDYARLDAAYLADKTNPTASTGWYNGDFNYDGVINGSDYTLIDNAFNTQGAQFTGLIASPDAAVTAQIGGLSSTAVPEPATLSLLALGGSILLGRRRRMT
jgi:autotransporter-associated beta strand protein